MADFPGLDLFGIEVKIDSGAYTSSFHCSGIDLVEINGEKHLKCNFLDPEHDVYHGKEFLFKNYRTRNIKSSNGLVEQRFAISVVIKIFQAEFPIEMTLTERTDMKTPVLLGRKFLSKKFVVDTSLKNLSFKGIITTIQ